MTNTQTGYIKRAEASSVYRKDQCEENKAATQKLHELARTMFTLPVGLYTVVQDEA